jgi:hypothetical protein
MSGALYLFMFDFPFIVDYNVDEKNRLWLFVGVAHLVLLVGETRPRAFHRDSECKRALFVSTILSYFVV